MKTKITRLTTTAVMAAISILFSACAAIDKDDAMHTERTLAAAEFKMRFADTPEKLDNVRLMTQRKLVPHLKDGQTYYVYADATFCECIYVGDEAAYQRYQKLAIQQQIAEEKMEAAQMNEEAAQMNEDAAMNWNACGVRGPWF